MLLFLKTKVQSWYLVYVFQIQSKRNDSIFLWAAEFPVVIITANK